MLLTFSQSQVGHKIEALTMTPVLKVVGLTLITALFSFGFILQTWFSSTIR